MVALRRNWPELSLRVLLLSFLVTTALCSRYKANQALRLVSAPSREFFAKSAGMLKYFAGGYEQLSADLLWLRFVQLIGDSSTSLSTRMPELKSLVENITELDPHFLSIYWFATLVIGGEGQNPQEADRILNLGIHANPESWQLPFMAGVNAYLFSHNNGQAATYYSLAAKLPNAPTWLARQSEILSSNVPSLINTIGVWEAIYASGQDKLVRKIATEKLCDLWLKVYEQSPSETIKRRAANKLKLLGVQARP